MICAGYTLGCFSTGYYLVRLRTGQDIRTIDSRSTGSTNVANVLGAAGFWATMLGDFAKGGLAVWAAFHFGLSPWGIVFVMIAVMAGHIWPAQLGFHGGKGLATGLGILAAFDYRLALITGGIALLGPLLGFGTVSFMAAAIVSPVVALFLDHQATEVAGLVVLVLLVLIAHRDNIRAFFDGWRGRKGLQA
ncbi:MAG: glycerol-3-phosphate acyltransferase [Acidobacteriia bacterium]|nr:glycerol-3-phosphate acyltransferase [Terriglobia bacterium]